VRCHAASIPAQRGRFAPIEASTKTRFALDAPDPFGLPAPIAVMVPRIGGSQPIDKHELPADSS